jgi:hypothetical protein
VALDFFDGLFVFRHFRFFRMRAVHEQWQSENTKKHYAADKAARSARNEGPALNIHLSPELHGGGSVAMIKIMIRARSKH